MEFFAIARVSTTLERLHTTIDVTSLPRFCPLSIERLIDARDGDHGKVWTVWGEFEVRREVLCNGLRFTLPGCHNALAWTVTTGHPPAPEALVVHATINRTAQDPDFIETLECFVDEWKAGLERTFAAPAGPHESAPR